MVAEMAHIFLTDASEIPQATRDGQPADYFAALVLRDLEGFSTEEVARALGSRPVTVRSQISSARAKLKTYCEKLLRRRGTSR